MPETLVIRLPENPAMPPECMLVDSVGAPAQTLELERLEDAAPLSEGRRVIGLAPASQVLRTRAEIPLRNKARILQALPFALEDRLAADVETQHFAFANRDEDGQLPVAVVARQTVQSWLDRLNDAGIKPDAIFSESDALTTVPSTYTVLVSNDSIIIRGADGKTTVADPDSLQAILELMFDDAAAPQPQSDTAPVENSDNGDAEPATEHEAVPVNILVYCGEPEYERYAVLWDMLRLRVDSLDVKIMPDGALPRLASQITTAGGVNLLQGSFAPKREIPVQWRQWQLPGALILGVLVLSLLQGGINLWQLNREEKSLDLAATELLRTTFPDANADGDPWNALQSRLGNTESTHDISAPGFAEAVEALAMAFASTPDIKLEALSFRDGNLDLQLIAPSVERLDQLRQGVARGNFTAEIQSANPDGETIKGRLKIAATGAGS